MFQFIDILITNEKENKYLKAQNDLTHLQKLNE